MYCKDTWTRWIPPNKLAAYRQLIDEGLISIRQVIYDRASGMTTVEYDTESPHEQIREELRKRSTLDSSEEMEE